MASQRKLIMVVILSSLLMKVALSQYGVVMGDYSFNSGKGFGEELAMFVNLDLGMKDKYVILPFIKITEIIFTNISADTVFGPSEGMDLVP
ncbi:hypothetical protein ISN44_As03g049680 [Arabidopsis suecica]|uniref:Uncharacterized protein n=1 Tax=Arabidopsis suecica TaxID=45249 RepID=A0A8T2FFE0_ARASU|nr:hypothetical protein ISN44_As03g049680 [Arabidopsis suecica]